MISATQALPEALIRLGVLQLYVAQFVGRWHRDSLIYSVEDLALLIYDAIREGRETIMQAPPERDAVGRRGRNGNRAQPRDMFMAHLRGEFEIRLTCSP